MSYDELEFDLKSFCPSPWKILECYFESNLQMGVIQDLNGDRINALRFLTRGKTICEERFPVIGLAFSSALGKVYCKEQNLKSAKSEFRDTLALFKCMEDFPCKKCKLRLAGTIFQNSLLFFYNRKTASPVKVCDVVEEYKVAHSKLNDSEWINSISCNDYNSHLEVNMNCICKTSGCWQCLLRGVVKSTSVIDFVHLKWESVRRRLSLQLFSGLGKFLENNTELTDGISEDMSLLNCILQSMSLLVSGNAFSPAISTDLFLDTMGQDITGFDLSVELAELLYNIFWWCLQARSDRTSRTIFSDLAENDLAKNLPRLLSWLVLAFVTSREVPVLFQKVAKLLAMICSLNYATLDHDKHSPFLSCRDLGYFTPEWASYFHQASLGSDMPSSTKRNLAPQKVADLGSFVKSFFERLPSTPVICLSVIGGSYGNLLQQLVSTDSSLQAWILITRLRSNRKPINLLLPIPEMIEGGKRDWEKNHENVESWLCPWGSEGSTEIEDIIPEYRIIMEGVHLLEQHADVRPLDNRLKTFIGRLEDLWFGYAKYLLLGEWSSSKALNSVYDRLRKKFKGKKKLFNQYGKAFSFDVISLIGSSKAALNEKRFLSLLHTHGIVQLTHHEVECIKKELQILESIKTVEREPIIFVLEPQVQMLPMEHLPIMRNQEAYRMPSLWSIFEIMKKQPNNQIPSIAPKESFALLNPDKSLPLAEKMLLQQLIEKGVMVRTHEDIPSHEEFVELLKAKNLYIYVGHNTGKNYFPLHLLRELRGCAAAFLMGCANGSARLKGCYAPYCVPLYYLHAGSPVVICTLWEILSGESASFTNRLIELLFQESSKEPGSTCTIGALLQRARSGSTFKYVDAPQICYGVPTGII
ncbi:hypothetical protein ABKV19_016148 [Rosa sericea]